MYYIELSEVIYLINTKSAQVNVVHSQCECPSINAELTIQVLCLKPAALGFPLGAFLCFKPSHCGSTSLLALRGSRFQLVRFTHNNDNHNNVTNCNVIHLKMADF